MELIDLLTPPSATPPYQFNWQYRNSMQYWSGQDQQALFDKNLKNSETAKQLQDLGWDKTEITYCYNSHGFRSAEFNRQECGIALGCSFTEGTGLPIENTWPYLLSNLCGTQVWNLGSGGASIDTVFRIFEYYVQTLSPKFVCILLPPPMRFEFNDSDNGFPIIQTCNLGNHPSFAKDWLSQDFNGINNRKKTVLAIAKICDLLKIPLIVGESQNLKVAFPDMARDLSHFGINYQKWQANYMLDQLLLKGIKIKK
jgi:hypothetical protein